MRMDTIMTVAVAAGLAFACLGAPARPYGGGGAAFPSTHGYMRGNGGAQRVGPGRGPASHPYGHVNRNVHWGESSLHRPWAGSISYERKKDAAAAHSATLQAKQETRSMLHLMNAEAESERRRQASEWRQAEQQASLEAAKAEVRDLQRQRATEHKAFLQEQTDEIRRRAAEQENFRMRRLAEQEAEHDRIMAELKPCRAYNADGSICTRKANPGMSFCHLHVGYTGALQPSVEKPILSAPVQTVQEPAEDAATEPVAVAPAPIAESRPVAIQPIVVQTPAIEGGSSMERSLVLVVTVLSILVCLVAVGGITLVAVRLLPRRPSASVRAA